MQVMRGGDTYHCVIEVALKYGYQAKPLNNMGDLLFDKTSIVFLSHTMYKQRNCANGACSTPGACCYSHGEGQIEIAIMRKMIIVGKILVYFGQLRSFKSKKQLTAQEPKIYPAPLSKNNPY